MQTKIFDRQTKKYYIEKQAGGKSLKFLYKTPVGRTVLKYFVSGKTASKIAGKFIDMPISRYRIKPFIRKNGIDMSEYMQCRYRSFSDFFIRQINESSRPIDNHEDALIAVADSKLLYYPIDENAAITIKNAVYTIDELAGYSLTDDYKGGSCLVFRLSVDNYHHYCYFDNGEAVSSNYIEGRLHTVSPISFKKYKVFSENCREVSCLNTENFGEAVQIEVGALLVGKINNIPKQNFKRGEEKGWFEMGGSTCVILLRKNAAIIDDDIIKNSMAGIETRVRIGEKIGQRKS